MTYLAGTSGDDAIAAPMKGTHVLDGGAGNDRLTGGNGSDVLIGGSGDNFLKGGNGHDTFLFNTLSTGKSTIADFKFKADHVQL